MSTLLIALASFAGFIVAYNTYGKFLARKIFRLQDDEPVPSVEQEDGVDFVPTNRYVIFGHHFTSIAGTGPIVGAAVAVMWGWLPALLWVVIGSIFIGAVHDFTALVMSLRNRGKSLGDIAGRVISPSAKLLLLLMLCFLLAIVIAVFANVIATTFKDYPQSVVPSVMAIPIAVGLGLSTRRFGVSLKIASTIAVAILFGFIFAVSEWPALTLAMPDLRDVHPMLNATMLWSWVILIYCYFASVLPVWLLLQPRDYINSLVLYITMTLIVAGILVAGISGGADIVEVAPALRISEAKENGSMPILPFLFITVACGAVSGFHGLVCSGTTSKQVASAKDARFIAYGGMLLEATLAVLVILSCTAGLALGVKNVRTSAEATGSKAADTVATPEDALTYVEQSPNPRPDELAARLASVPETIYGRDAWNLRYNRKASEVNLGEQVGVFIEGGGNFIARIGIPEKASQGIIAILIACFAATTIDSVLRLFRYVLHEVGEAVRFKPLGNRYIAAGVGLFLGGALALCKAGPAADYGTGGMILWPLFGAGNQIVAGLTLLIGSVYLLRRKTPALYLLLPAIIMMVIPLWGLLYQICLGRNSFLFPIGKDGSVTSPKFALLFCGLGMFLLACWLVFEAYRVMRKLVRENDNMDNEQEPEV